jgi:solute:Na+ symporter, SSS family
MNTSALLYFFLFTCIVAIISWVKRQKHTDITTESYFMGNRSFSFFLVGGMLFLTNLNGVQFIGENESVYLNNMSVMAWGVTSVVAMVIVAEFFLPIYLKSGLITTPDFLEERYDKSTKQTVSLIFLIGYILNMLPSVLYGGAVVFNGLFHLSDHLGVGVFEITCLLVWFIGLSSLVYTIFGGIKVVAISDTLLGACLFIIGIALPYFGFKYLGKGSFTEGVNIVLSSKTEHLNAIGSATDAVPFSTLFTGMLLVNLYYWGMEQYIIQRALSAKSLADSQKGMALAAFGKLISPLMLNIPGLIAVHLYPTIRNTPEVFPRLASDVLPNILIGLLAAVILGAAVTGFNAGLNSASTLFVLNLYKPYKEKKHSSINERNLVKVGKNFQIIITLCAMLIAPLILFAKGGFYMYLQTVGGAFSVPIFTVLFIGFSTKKVPPIAAKIGLTFFVITYGLSQTIVTEPLHFLHILAILFLITTSIMLVIGRLYPMPIPYVGINKSKVALEPWKNRFGIYVVLIALMLLLYYGFSGVSQLN